MIGIAGRRCGLFVFGRAAGLWMVGRRLLWKDQDVDQQRNKDTDQGVDHTIESEPVGGGVRSV